MFKKEEFEEFNGTLSNLADLPNYLEKINQNILNIDKKISNQISKENNKMTPKVNSLKVKYSENKKKKEDLNELKNIVKKSIEGINGIIDDEKFDVKKTSNNLDSKKKGKNLSNQLSAKNNKIVNNSNKNNDMINNQNKIEKSKTETARLENRKFNKKNNSNIISENEINNILLKNSNNRYINNPSNEEEPQERKLTINKIEPISNKEKRNPSKSPNRIYSFKPKSSKRKISISTSETNVNKNNDKKISSTLNNDLEIGIINKKDSLKKNQIVENCNIIIDKNYKQKSNNIKEKENLKNNDLNKNYNEGKNKSSLNKLSSKNSSGVNSVNIYSKDIPKNIEINDILKMMLFYNEYILTKLNFNNYDKMIMNSYSSFLYDKIFQSENKNNNIDINEDEEIDNKEKSVMIIQRKWRDYKIKNYFKRNKNKNINDELRKFTVDNFIDKEGFGIRKVIGNLNLSLENFINLKQKNNFIKELKKGILGFNNKQEKYKFYKEYINNKILKNNINEFMTIENKTMTNKSEDEETIDNN